jgi:GMP synthase (glutamine-hydrolysing)
MAAPSAGSQAASTRRSPPCSVIERWGGGSRASSSTTGVLRGEAKQVESTFREHFHLKLVTVDARERFLSALKGVTDPEEKRKIIGRVFIEVFEDEAKKVQDARFLVQGTLYPDVIESVSFKGPSAVIKSHHNVGGLPERMKLASLSRCASSSRTRCVRPANRSACPRRCCGATRSPGRASPSAASARSRQARLAVLRDADAIVTEEIRAAGLYDSIWQAFCVLLPVKTVGVMGDERTYEEVCALRAVSSVDGMTADWSPIPHPVLARISTRIINEVRGINRVVYDISSKPPATIEWE